MKYCGLVVAAVLIAGGAFGNLLVNADFEAGVTADWSSTPKAWEINSTIHGPGGAAEGANYGSMQTGGNSTAPYLVWQTVSVPAGTPALNFSGSWAGGEAGTWSGDHGVWLFDGTATTGASLWEDVLHFDAGQGTGGWRPFDVTVPTPGGGLDGDQATVVFGWINGSGGWSDGSATHGDAFDLTAVPEPATMLLGLAGLALLRRRR